ncbi:stage II sporulation protein M [Halovenus halobia]|uniref:stage II sporulation protein M n=1 Tax=Halovenus halobia TaxID=3396622 RepID=UPI003F57D4A7
MAPGDSEPPAGSLLGNFHRDLRDGIAVHLPYALGSALLVCCSVVAGALSQTVGTGQLARLPFTKLASSVLTQERSVAALVQADTELLAVLVIGAVTLGIATALGLVAQGVVVGIFLGSSVGTIRPVVALVAVAPHGLVKLLGLALAASVSFRLVARALAVLIGVHSRFLTNREWRQTGLVIGLAWVTLLLAAVIESFVTLRLVRLF